MEGSHTVIQNMQNAKTFIRKEVSNAQENSINEKLEIPDNRAYSSLLYRLSYPDHVSTLHFNLFRPTSPY
jgi:hypothetical protein